MILSFLASDSVGMIYMRSNLDDNLTWVLGVHIWHSEGAINEKYWFGLHRGCATSTWPKLKCTPQNYPACKISGHFIHWGLFYGTPLSKNLDFSPPLLSMSEIELCLWPWISWSILYQMQKLLTVNCPYIFNLMKNYQSYSRFNTELNFGHAQNF